jgi:hypothetical protein
MNCSMKMHMCEWLNTEKDSINSASARLQRPTVMLNCMQQDLKRNLLSESPNDSMRAKGAQRPLPVT